ncbi:hypothetical protein PBY51_011596 [Eleginops maclovinus]|uniref:Uncharacterized protein n=1 Tax=Eleginops maclovinus TaxID=56733 RepID=A0AAN7XVK7_ELEMC|nr:hypothetical protein PBY51_011596 [Eleginops maclovinus]
MRPGWGDEKPLDCSRPLCIHPLELALELCVSMDGSKGPGYKLRETASVLVNQLEAQMAVWIAAKTNRREVQRTEQGHS